MTPDELRSVEPSRHPRVALYIHRLQIANPTGVHRYATELATSVADLAKDELDIELCSGKVREPVELLSPQLRLSHPNAPRRPLHLSWTMFGRPEIERLIGRIDLLHTLLPVFPIRSRAPQVMTIHDLLPIHRPEWYPGIYGLAVRRALWQSPTLEAVITPSQTVADDAIRTLGVDASRIRVVPEGVGETFTRPVDSAAARETLAIMGLDSRPYLITVGAISPRKNLQTVFAALAQLGSRGEDAPDLVVVGASGLGADATMEAAQSSGVGHLIRFTGRVDDEKLQHLLAHAIALVHPSLYEGFGLTPLEAMATGTPVIASTMGAVPETVGDAAILADPVKPAVWADAIRVLLQDGEARQQLVSAGHARAAAMSWSQAAAATVDVYRRLLSDS